MSKEEFLEEMTKVRPEVLTPEALKLFNCINETLDDIAIISAKYKVALEILSENNTPCELDNFMDKNTDYCSINCGFDKKIFKQCWDKYISKKVVDNINEKY